MKNKILLIGGIGAGNVDRRIGDSRQRHARGIDVLSDRIPFARYRFGERRAFDDQRRALGRTDGAPVERDAPAAVFAHVPRKQDRVVVDQVEQG